MPKFVAAAIAALVAALLVGLGAQTAGAASSCHLSTYEQRHLGTNYVRNVKVKKVGCAKAKKVVKAYHACRHKHGPAGKCTKKVAGGWKCSDKRFDVISFQYDAKMTCKKGTARIFSGYTQFT